MPTLDHGIVRPLTTGEIRAMIGATDADIEYSADDDTLTDCVDCGDPTSEYDDGSTCDDCGRVSHADCQREAHYGAQSWRLCQDCG